MQESVHVESRCQTCPLRARAEAKPHSLFGKVWRWHTGWCPGWKAYTRELTEKGIEIPKV